MTCTQEYCTCAECISRPGSLDDPEPLTLAPDEPDPVLVSLRALISVIERVGGYMPPDDQAALHIARQVSRSRP